MSYIEFQNITKEYNTGGNAIFALKDASFSVEKGLIHLGLRER